MQAKNWDQYTARKPVEGAKEDKEFALGSNTTPGTADDMPPQRSEEEDIAKMPRWKQVLSGQRFDLVVGFLICLNAMIMALELEYQGGKVGTKLGLSDEDHDVSWPHAADVFSILNFIFTMIFVVELFLRVSVHGCHYLANVPNLMDALVVMVTAIDNYILTPLGVAMPNVTFIRLLRIVKLVRVLRVVRVMRIFHQLRVLVHSITASMGALGWSMVLLFVIQIIASIFMAQVLGTYLDGEQKMKDEVGTTSIDWDSIEQIYAHFGTWSRAFITMFEITLAPGTWSRIGRVLSFEVSGWYAIFFGIYLAMVSFAVIRVITAIFLKETLDAAKNDREIVLTERMRQKNKYIGHLREVFEKVDRDGGGHLSFEEFSEVISDEEVKSWLSMLELDVHEVTGLFQLLDSGDGTISFEEFISGIMRMKGSAKSVDLVTLLFENKKIMDKLNSLVSTMGSIERRLEDE